MNETSSLALESSVVGQIPAIVKSELAKMSADKQAEFLEEFERKSAKMSASYFCSLLFCHYGYLGKWGMTVIMWLASIFSLGIVGAVWWIIDLFRMPKLVKNYNRDIAINVLRDMKIIYGNPAS